MSEPKDQVRVTLETLARHAELVAEGLSGSLASGDKARNKAVEALAGIHALLPYEEGVYHLNPRLRSYLSDHLAFFGAFQTVTRLSEHILRARTQWRELKELKRSGSNKDVDTLEWALDDTVSDIVYFTEQNLVLLNSMIYTRYGNVESLKAKLAQNRFYAQEVKICLRELQQVDQMVDEIGSEAIAAGLPGTRQVVHGRLRSRLSGWVARLNDIQSVITRRLFQVHKLEQRLIDLTAVSLWLVRNPTKSGSEVPVDRKTPIELFRPKAIKLVPQVDFSVATGTTAEVMASAVGKMPKRRDAREQKPDRVLPPVVVSAMEVVEDSLSPEDSAIAQLIEQITSARKAGISVGIWRRQREDLEDITEEEWLLYAATQIVAAGKKVIFVNVPRDRDMLNDEFSDVLAYEAA